MVLAALTFGAGLLAALPMMAAVIGGQSLTQSLADALVPVRNIEVESASLTERLTAVHDDVLQAEIGSFTREKIEIRDAALDAEQNIYRVDGTRESVFEFLRLRFRSFTKLDENAQLIAGEWPSPVIGTAASGERLVEVGVGAEAAERMGLQVGDQFAVLTQGEALNSEQAQFRVQIVGILNPSDPEADIWWGDPDLVPFSLFREQVTIDLQRINLSVFIPSEVMETQIPEHRHYWHAFVNSQAITVSNADVFRDQIVNLSSRLGTMSATLNSGLPELIDTFALQLSQAQVSLLLLTAQSLLAVLYTLGLISAFWLDQTQFEVATMVGRGLSSGQITRLFAVQAFFLALGIALPLGPVGAYYAFQLWSRVTGTAVLPSIPTASWQLALIAVALGWLTFVVFHYLATRRNMLAWSRQRARQERHSRWRRFAFDLFLLVLGGLAYWQLTQTGTVVHQEEGLVTADPVLLLGPSLLLLAIGLMLHRLFPLLIRLIARISHAARGFILPIGLTRLARDSTGPGQVLLLISLSAGLIFFATVFGNSIRVRQRDIADYAIGADITIRQARAPEVAAADQAHVMALPGVLATTPVYRGKTRPVGRSFSALNLLAVDPNTLTQVTTYPKGISPIPMDTLARILQPESTESAVLPLILSSDAAAREAQLGDHLFFAVGPEEIEFEVSGIIADFPTLSNPFMITSLPELEKRIDLNSPAIRLSGERELWLATEPTQHTHLVEMLTGQTREAVGLATYQAGRVIGDAQFQLQSYQSDVAARQTTAAFNLNAVVLVILSSVAFLLIQVFVARRRFVEFGVLRAIGLSTTQLLRLLSVEGVIVLALGLLAGLGIGYGLANMMRPFLSLILATGLGGLAIDQIAISWPKVGQLYLLLALFHVAGMIGLLAALKRRQIHRTLRLADE
jgi:putative ABC transport system permease protein